MKLKCGSNIFNGVQARIFIHGFRRLLLYSTSSSSKAEANPSSSLTNYLVEVLGFSSQQSLFISTRLAAKNVSTDWCNWASNAYLVSNFFKQNGFDESQIRKIIFVQPRILLSNVDKTLNRVEAVKGSGSGGGTGLFSAIGRAIEEEEYRKARAEVQRKGFEIEGYSVEGLSVGGHETCVIVPEFKVAFDIGRCPLRAVHQNFVCITHAHLDHIGGLPMYVATRALYSLKPPTIFVPPSIKDDVEELFDIHRSMGQVELNFDLVALDVGETYELRNDLVVRPFKTHHVIPSQGYVIYSIRKKLKKQYIHLKGKQIEKLKKSGVEITDKILSPEVAFTGDTTSDFLLEPRNADALRAKLLITEATFLDDGFSVEDARERGHTHLFELIEHAQWIRNKTVMLTHFSSRYHLEDIRQAVSKLQAKVSAKVVPLTEGFKSMYS